MKKILLFVNLFVFSQITPLSNICNCNTFDLTSKIPELINNQNPIDFNVNFYLSQADAIAGVNPIGNSSAFAGVHTQVIYVKILNIPTNVSTLNSFSLLQPPPLIAQISYNSTSNEHIVNTVGGVFPYFYSINGTGFQQSNVFTNLISGNSYVFQIRDSLGCIISILYNANSNIIDAVNDNYNALTFNGTMPPWTILGNVTFNDTLNSSPITTANTNITPVDSGPLSIDSDGNLTIIPNPSGNNTPGIYTIIYTICEADPLTGLNVVPANCDTAIATVTVDNNIIDAVNDFYNASSSSGTIGSVILNDTINGLPIAQGNVLVNALTTLPAGIVLDSYGTITLPSSIANGTYTFNYQICNNSGLPFPICDTATVTITIQNTFIATYTATYQDLNSDGFTNLGDVVNYAFIINNISSDVLTNITMSNNGTSLNISGGPIASLNAGAQDSTTFNGVHVITQQDINQGFVSLNASASGTSNGNLLTANVLGNTTLNLSNGIKLNAFIDTNGNGFQDGVEQNISSGNFTTQLNSGTIHNIISNNGMYYFYESNPVNSYNFGYVINPSVASQYTIVQSTYSNISVATGSGITILNFALTVIPFNDLAIYLNNYSFPPRPGFTYYNYITYQNFGNTTIANGTVTFNSNNVVSITNVSTAGAVLNPNGFTYNLPNLLPNETRIITVTMQVPTIPTVSLGQQLTNSASITIPANDININNNNSSLTQTIVGSYDPNDKTESHGGRILRSSFTNNDYLTYTIQFENTGTANAVSVKVNDVLDAKLDETSIKMVAASHNYVLDRTGSNLEWKFAGIDLPPSVANTQIGHGYIVFQIKPKPGYAVGDIIPNIANIYFDFNPAIITNTCTTEFVASLANDNFAFNNLNIYPNPVNNILNIENNNIIDNIEISNVLGQTVLSQNNNNSKIDLSGLIGGIYFVKISSLGNEKIVKILKD